MEVPLVKEILERGLPGATVMVGGDGRHFEATVISDIFAGKNRVQQHQLVYAALGEALNDDAVHALSIKTFTQQQWRDRGAEGR